MAAETAKSGAFSVRSAAPALSVEDLRVVYRKGDVRVEAVRGISFEVPSGDFLAIEGPSGSGKSSLLRTMAGLWPASGGRVLLAGAPLTERTDTELAELRRRRIGFLHQLFNLLPDLTAAENVALPLALDGVPTREMDERVARILERLGIAALADRNPEELSGGEMLRVALARALVIEPVIVLADEPTGSLDRENARAVLNLFRELQREDGVTLVVVTHDPEVAAAASRRLRMVDGRLVE